MMKAKKNHILLYDWKILQLEIVIGFGNKTCHTFIHVSVTKIENSQTN